MLILIISESRIQLPLQNKTDLIIYEKIAFTHTDRWLY